MKSQRSMVKWFAMTMAFAMLFESALVLPSASAQGENTPTPTPTVEATLQPPEAVPGNSWGDQSSQPLPQMQVEEESITSLSTTWSAQVNRPLA